LVSKDNSVCATFDLFCKSYIARSKNHDMLSGNETNTLKLGLGHTISTGLGNITWTPIYLYSDITTQIRVEANGIAPFLYNYGSIPYDNVTMEKEYTFYQLT
jgi:hypothetical protein